MSEYDAQALDQLAPAYIARLGLHSAPFGERIDGRFLYLDPDRAQRLSLIQHLTQYSELLLIVKGARGSGKTSLLDYYSAQADAQWRVCRIQAHTMMDANGLLDAIVAGFGLDVADADPRELVYRYAADQHHAGRIPVLLIDDAHELPADALEAIFLLADAETADGAGLLRILLFCEPQIEALLDAPALRPHKARITHTLDMPLLDDEQTAAYLRQRLAAAGYHGPALFTDREIRHIHKAAQGLPGRVNAIAHQRLLQGGNARRGISLSALTRGFNRRSVMLAGGGLVILLALWALQDRINALFQPAPAPTQTVSLAVPATPIGAATTTPLGTQPATGPGVARPAGTTPQRPVSRPAPVTPPAAIGPASGQPIAASHRIEPTAAGTGRTPMPAPSPSRVQIPVPVKIPARSGAPRLTGISPSPVADVRTPQVLTLSGSGFRPGLAVIVAWNGRQQRLAPEQIQVDSDSRLRLTLTTGVRVTRGSVQVRDPRQGTSNTLYFKLRAPTVGTSATAKPAVRPTMKSVPKSTPGSRGVASVAASGLPGEAWLRTRNPAHFTLQLVSTHRADNVLRFVRVHHLRRAVASFHLRRRGQSWYSVVWGDYPSRAAAQDVARHLPARLQGITPWVRRFGDIQLQLRRGSAVRRSAMTATRHQTRAVRRPPSPPPGVHLPGVDLPGQGVRAHLPAGDAGGAQALAWMWDQDPRHYTLQLLGARSQASVRAYIRTHRLTGKVVYFKTQRDGRNWYSLVYGVYRDRQQALQASTRLPVNLRQSHPWPRSFAGIQAVLSPPAPKLPRPTPIH